jgi:hypothetical protein
MPNEATDLQEIPERLLVLARTKANISFLLKSGDAIQVYSNAQAITLQLRREVPTEVDVAATSFKASVVLTPADALAVAGELLTAAAAQLKSKA